MSGILAQSHPIVCLALWNPVSISTDLSYCLISGSVDEHRIADRPPRCEAFGRADFFLGMSFGFLIHSIRGVAYDFATLLKNVSFCAAAFLWVSARCPYTFPTKIPPSLCPSHWEMVMKSSPAITH